MEKYLTASVFAVFILTIFMCSSESDEKRDALADAKRRWSGQALQSYSYVLVNTGFAPHDSLLVSVSGNVVVKVVDLNTGEVRTSDNADIHLKTVEELFDEIETEMDLLSAENVRVTYDETLGYPVSAYYDGGSEGWGFDILSLTRK